MQELISSVRVLREPRFVVEPDRRAAIGLALTISLFRQRKTLNVEEADTMLG